MKKLSSFCFILFTSLLAFSQARLVMNNDPFVVISNSAFIVIENSNANAITETGTGGRIVSEAETNVVRWNISSTTGSYTLPYYDTDNSLEIPFIVNIGTAGSAGGRIDFSTYDGASWDNNTYRPSDVTNMSSSVGGANNSAKVIDRFWIADASSYGTKPSATLTFTYIDAEWSAAGNSITEGNLGAQRFETPNGDWDTYLPQGTWANAGTRGTVSNAPATPANFWRSWTLTDNSSPLPIELITFSGECANRTIELKWSTSSETNNDFFSIERSNDGINYFEIGSVDGAGNSTTLNHYIFTDNSISTGAYYRIRQTDFNANSKLFNVIFVPACNESDSDISVYSQEGNEFIVAVNSFSAGNYTISVYNALGQKIISRLQYFPAGSSKTSVRLDNVDDSMYFINVNDGKETSVTKKIVVN